MDENGDESSIAASPAEAWELRPATSIVSVAALDEGRLLHGTANNTGRRLFVSGPMRCLLSDKAEAMQTTQYHSKAARKTMTINIKGSNSQPSAREPDRMRDSSRRRGSSTEEEPDGKSTGPEIAKDLRQWRSAEDARQPSPSVKSFTAPRYVQSRRKDFCHTEKPVLLHTHSETRSGYSTSRSIKGTPSESPRSKPSSSSGSLFSLRSRSSPNQTEINLNTQREEDFARLDAKLENEFEQLMVAIEGVSKNVQVALVVIHDRMDGLQGSLEAMYKTGWKALGEKIEQARSSSLWKKPHMEEVGCQASTNDPLFEATEIAREEVRILTGLLIVEKDAELLSVRDFQDRKAMLLKMMESHGLTGAAFDQFWHMKYGLDHCLASILFRNSNILARTQSVIAHSSSTAEAQENAQFRRFCKRGQRTMEVMAGWPVDKQWSAHLRGQFLSACSCVWLLQKLVVASMAANQMEILQPEAGCLYDESAMDSLDCVVGDRFKPLVQFTIFPGYRIDGTILIKPQVYLQPKINVISE